MKFLVVSCKYYTAGAEFFNSGYPTVNVAPILKKMVRQYKTLDNLLSYLESRRNFYKYTITDIPNETTNPT